MSAPSCLIKEDLEWSPPASLTRCALQFVRRGSSASVNVCSSSSFKWRPLAPSPSLSGLDPSFIEVHVLVVKDSAPWQRSVRWKCLRSRISVLLAYLAWKYHSQ
ncbi:hypothetical protein BaRGS_00030661 [Batillaria attramentaria]|uniref:Uncharacterized protein n=1 Tax=Batillaria attramentaria TaxID=370345 RepID=A0ABD0JTI7_9CAEN